jgi:hypothetical protein
VVWEFGCGLPSGRWGRMYAAERNRELQYAYGDMISIGVSPRPAHLIGMDSCSSAKSDMWSRSKPNREQKVDAMR